MKKLISAAFVLTLAFSVQPAQALSFVIGGGVLTQSEADTIAGWLGEGDLVLTNIYSGAPGTPAGFHAAADGAGRTFTVADVLMDSIQHRVGGYNPLSWDSSYDYHYTVNGDAFVYNLTSGLKYDQLAGSTLSDPGYFQTFNHPYHGPEFGAGADLYFLSTDEDDITYPDGYAFNYSYGPSNVFGVPADGVSLLTTLSLDVYSIQAVPEPSSLTLLGGSLLALVGVLRRKLRR